VAACTTKKNTSGTRAYHNVTSRYNILFNGTEAYKKGMLSLQQSYKDNYTEILPVFLYTEINQLSAISSDMDRAITKATKLVSMHSLTVKPELDEKKNLSSKQREYYNKNEYNKWVDDSYLLMAKAHFHKHEFSKASETFQYILTNYPEESTIYETRLWIARLAITQKRTKEAEEIIESLEKDINFPKNLYSHLYASKADMAIRAENYQEAISLLKKTLEFEKKRYFKQRYNFILAQLYQEIKEYGTASKYYKEVIKLNPPYEMTFNARINMALTYESGRGSRKEIEKQLQKMLRDDKNIEYQDQIYYAWGNLYLQSGDEDKALEYYKLSAALGKENTTQLAITYLTIADIYYEKPDYAPAQSYYDSAVGVIDADYPGYPIIFAKSVSLTNLVDHLYTVKLEDSVQFLAKKPKNEIYALVDKIIDDVKEEEEEQRRLEQEKQLQDNYSTQQQFELQTNKGASWYFYNPTSLKLGKQEFKRIWGPRKLEDDWRRKNKSSNTFDNIASTDEPEEAESAGVQGKKGNKYSRDYYLQNIPFTDSALAKSHNRIKASLFEIGNIYFNDLKDYEKAQDVYIELIQRYPKNDYELRAYYKLYSIGKETENKELVSKYKQKIISEYPNSNYAKVLTDPDYFKKIEEQERKYKELYAGAYDMFQNGQFAQVANISRRALNEISNDELVPYFEYLLVVSEGVAKDTVQFITDLQDYIIKYPDSEVVSNATKIIEYLETANPEAAYQQKTQEAKSLYTYNPDEKHYVGIAVIKSANTNQLMFNIINYNIDNFEEKDLKIIKADIDLFALLAINPFNSEQNALEYYMAITSSYDIWKDVSKKGSKIFIISESNYNILKEDNNLESYLIFFNEQYNK
jgi:tetratricopeptide (TPR) repeat protein